MKKWWGIALVGGLMVSATCRAETVDQRFYDLSLRADATPHWLEMQKVPHLLNTDNRWSVQRVRSKRLHLSAGIWAASVYVVRPSHVGGATMEQPAAGRVSSAAAGADLSLRVAEGFTLVTRAAALKVRSRSYFSGFRPQAAKSDRVMIGAGVESAGNATLLFDYIQTGGGRRRSIDRSFGLPRGGDQFGSGSRLTLANAGDDAIGWALSLTSMQRPEMQYGQAMIAPERLDRRIEFGLRIGL